LYLAKSFTKLRKAHISLYVTGETSGTNQWVNETTFVLESAANLQALIPTTSTEGEKVLPSEELVVLWRIQSRSLLNKNPIGLFCNFLIFDIN